MSDLNTYGSFNIGDEEFLLEVSNLQEVINFPDVVSKMPLAPDFILGVTQIRDMALPIVSISKLLGINSAVIEEDSKVVISNYLGARIGLCFDGTGDVYKLPKEVFENVTYSNDKEISIVKGVVSLESGKKILQLIDLFKVLNIENLPSVQERLKDKENVSTEDSEAINSSKKYVSFQCNELICAIEMNSIKEIIELENLKPASFSNEICEGVLNLRGHVLPVVSFCKLFKKGFELKEGKKVIVLNDDGFLIGVLVDEVISLDTIKDRDVLDLPLFSKEESSFFTGCTSTKVSNHTLVFSKDLFCMSEEVSSLKGGFNKIHNLNTSSHSSSEHESKGEKVTYLTLFLKYFIGVKINEIQEIVEVPKDLVITPNMPAFVLGMYNLRDRLVTIINLRKVYSLDEAEVSKDSKIIIKEVGGELFGFLVDRVDGILGVYEQDSFNLPELMTKSIKNNFQNDLEKVLSVETSTNDNKAMAILNLNSIVENLNRVTPSLEAKV